MSELTAYHESGHALVAFLLGARVNLITLEPEKDDGPQKHGYTQILWRRDRLSDKEFAQKAVQVCLAGPVAEMIYSGDPYHPGLVGEWANDWREAWNAAAPLCADERKRLAYLEQSTVELHQKLRRDDHWNALAALADNLLAHETLDREQFQEFIEEWQL
jgi:ATP-dependent Zn protease